MTTLRIFLSSPTDLVDERGIALSVIDDLGYEPEIAARVAVEAVAWDDLGRGRPVFATEPPQASLDRGKRRPADCDVVVVIFWGRMGTPLPHPQYRKSDGSPYLSGTEWEYVDALAGHARHGRPLVLLYRRQPMPGLDVTSSTFDEDVVQQRRIVEFFETQRDDDGAIVSGTNTFASPEEFRQLLRRDLRFAIAQLASDEDATVAGMRPAVWKGSPFPGLRPFTPRDAPIFFGRGRSIDAVVERLARSRFVAVVGASGSGKSSLVGAGVIPRLASLAVPGVDRWWLPDVDPGTGRWTGLRFTPGASGGDPMLALAAQVAPALARDVVDVAEHLRRAPDALSELVAEATGRTTAVETLVFIDQFEELFTITQRGTVEQFVRLLSAATMATNVRVVVTMRSDFYPRCLEVPALAGLLEFGHVPLAQPSDTLSEMIERPAFRAGLRFEEGLVDRILRDAGQELASLPLLAYTLDELYRASDANGVLTFESYLRIGGLHGAIGSRADVVFDALDHDAQLRFSDVFKHLLDVDIFGRVSRRREDLGVAAPDRPARELVDAFANAGLLVTESAASVGQVPVVFVAHEALFDSWPRLARWISEVRDDLSQVRAAEVAAREWEHEGRPDSHRWPHERMAPVLDAVARLGATLETRTLAFLEPEHDRLLVQLRDPSTPNHQKRALADRLGAIGAPAVTGLADALGDSDPVVRSVAASTLARIGGASLDQLALVIAGGSPHARIAAVTAAVELGDDRLAGVISSALADDDVRVRSLARGALSTLGGEDAVAALGDDLLRTPVDDRWESAGALAALGATAAPSLASAMNDRSAKVRSSARRAASAAGLSLVPGAIPLLSASDAATQLGAARLLAAVGRPALEALRAARLDDDPEVRALAVAAIAESGEVGGIDDLVAASRDDDVDVRRAAVAGLERYADATMVPTLLALLDDADGTVRDAAVRALAGIGTAIEQPVRERLGAPGSRTIRLQTVRQLARIGAVVADAFAEQALVERDDSVRRQLIGAIGEFGAEGVAALSTLATGSRTVAADEAVNALAALGDVASEALIDLARSGDDVVRRRAVAGLSATSDVRAAPVLVECLRDSEAVTRRSAATALAAIGVEAVPMLMRAMSDADAEVREAAATGLVECGGLAVPSLMAAVGSEGFDAELVVETLRTIGTPTALLALAGVGHNPSGETEAQ